MNCRHRTPPHCRRVLSNNFIVKGDNARPHRAGSIISYFEEAGVMARQPYRRTLLSYPLLIVSAVLSNDWTTSKLFTYCSLSLYLLVF